MDTVVCKNCAHFTPDDINPTGGMGECPHYLARFQAWLQRPKLWGAMPEYPEPPLYPFSERECESFERKTLRAILSRSERR